MHYSCLGFDDFLGRYLGDLLQHGDLEQRIHIKAPAVLGVLRSDDVLAANLSPFRLDELDLGNGHAFGAMVAGGYQTVVTRSDPASTSSRVTTGAPSA